LDGFPHDLQDVDFERPRHPHRQAARASVDLPISSDLLYFLSRGSMANGIIIFDDKNDDSDDVNVTVTFLYHDDYFLEQAKVCLLQPKESHNGLGIFVSRPVNM
jgi:hypothetical protein